MNLDFHIRRPDHDFFCFVSGVSFFTSLKTSPNTYQVVDAVVDALTSQAPCDRYLVGSDARFFCVDGVVTSCRCRFHICTNGS